ncbi:MAG: hypothetical protein WDA68_12170 [Phycisphaerae bacterium]
MSKFHQNLDPRIFCASRDVRNRLETYRSRLEFLNEPDRILVKMFLDNANSYRQISKLLGVSVSTVSRRIEKITNRLSSENFSDVLRSRDSLAAVHLELAKDYFVRGLTIRALSDKYKTSFYRIWKILRDIKKRKHVKFTERRY